ncbi:hypothetical protein F5Y18DRAFT_86691 [Xylariaceae sp. FL1019]|nr:hypothetical protein F5Y18DRAFT_86691 [Xylariaceae sp. FL1019]
MDWLEKSLQRGRHCQLYHVQCGLVRHVMSGCHEPNVRFILIEVEGRKQQELDVSDWSSFRNVWVCAPRQIQVYLYPRSLSFKPEYLTWSVLCLLCTSGFEYEFKSKERKRLNDQAYLIIWRSVVAAGILIADFGNVVVDGNAGSNDWAETP